MSGGVGRVGRVGGVGGRPKLTDNCNILKKVGLLLLTTRCSRAFKIPYVPKNPSFPQKSLFPITYWQ